ncbi:uncharacterized protein JCM6883_006934 [Sporobolomyces salmoneus]|uniref:uncharacterized protein n=1 Tax=Sporobolomyces salmoneus TaxID=183962 RepID=UPI00317115A1
MLTEVAVLLSLTSSALAQAAGYAPVFVECPQSDLILRTGNPIEGNQILQANESSYLERRRRDVTPQLWRDYLNDNSTGNTGYSTDTVANAQPKIAIAVSGGGLRASLYAAGTLSAFDNRNSSSISGLWQLSDYLAGLSGGSWAVTSTALNDMVPIYELVLGNTPTSQTNMGWILDMDILAPDGLLGVSENKDYYDALFADVQSKANAGFPVSIVDIWGSALRYHFLNETTPQNFYGMDDHDEGTLFSAIKYTQNFQSGAMPIPLVVSTSRISEEAQTSGTSTTVIPLNNTQFEFTPFTFGSYDSTLQALIPIEYTGTALSNGQPANSSSCVNAFENAGFVMGSSAALFNAVQQEIENPIWTELIQRLLGQITDIQATSESIALVANYPNTFQNFQPAGGFSFESSSNTILQITDGGENGENVPLSPLLVKARELDFIIAADASADTEYSWPNGTSLLATADRAANFSNGFRNFPPIPASADDFVAQGLNVRPTFFGCNSTAGGNMSSSSNESYPIIVYLPNAPAPVSDPFLTNTSTFTLSYSYEEVEAFLDSANLNAKKGFPNSDTPNTPDSEFALALKCATVDRARQRAGVERSSACQTAFNRYCWNDGVADDLANATRNNAPQSTSGSSKLVLSSVAVPSLLLGLGLALLA